MQLETETDAAKAEKEKNPKRNKFKWSEHSRWSCLDEVGDFLESEGFVVFDDKDVVKNFTSMQRVTNKTFSLMSPIRQTDSWHTVWKNIKRKKREK